MPSTKDMPSSDHSGKPEAAPPCMATTAKVLTVVSYIDTSNVALLLGRPAMDPHTVAVTDHLRCTAIRAMPSLTAMSKGPPLISHVVMTNVRASLHRPAMHPHARPLFMDRRLPTEVSPSGNNTGTQTVTINTDTSMANVTIDKLPENS